MPFEKGQSGNPAGGKIGNKGGSGRPENAFRELCKQELTNRELAKRAGQMASGEIEKATARDQLSAIEFLTDRAFGKSDETHTHRFVNLKPEEIEFMEEFEQGIEAEDSGVAERE